MSNPMNDHAADEVRVGRDPLPTLPHGGGIAGATTPAAGAGVAGLAAGAGVAGQTGGAARWLALLRRPSVVAPLALLVVVVVVWGVLLVNAAQPKTPDQRAYAIESQLQCPICHGQSVANSPALLSQQMRAIIRQKLAQGESDQQIINDFRQSYGDSILMTPPPTTYVWLWGPPALILLLGGYLVYILGREWRIPPPALAIAGADYDDESDDAALAAMSADERRRLRDLLRRELAADDGAPLGLFADESDAQAIAPESGATPATTTPLSAARKSVATAKTTANARRTPGAGRQSARPAEGARAWGR